MADILIEQHGPIAVLTLNRPDVRNAIDDAMRGEMIATLEQVAADDAIRALVITGAGTAFCAGGDVRGMRARLEVPADQVAMNGWKRQQRTHRAVSLLHAMGKPTIAAVNGAAAGLGCDVALACDLIIAADTAHFTMSFLQRGLIPDGGGMYFLPRRIGIARTKDLVFSGRRVGAEEALQIGMIERMTTPAAVLTDALEWARQMTTGSAAALALAKATIDASLESSFEQVMAIGSQSQAICYTTEEHRASVAAFLAKSSRA